MADNEERTGFTLCGGVIALVFAGLGYMLLHETVRHMLRSGAKSDGVVGKCIYIVIIVIVGGCLLMYTAIALSMLILGALDFWQALVSLPRLAEKTKITPDPISMPPPPNDQNQNVPSMV